MQFRAKCFNQFYFFYTQHQIKSN
uniref:Uncharacterized protein n=1 Tax=Anopheles quadriannulatus TaxID=34691 RepID=A0A182XRY7_ANOQN